MRLRRPREITVRWWWPQREGLMGHYTIRKYALYFDSLVLRMPASYQLPYQPGKPSLIEVAEHLTRAH
jgi:hypothetical protein